MDRSTNLISSRLAPATRPSAASASRTGDPAPAPGRLPPRAAVRAALALRRWLLRAADQVVPPEVAVWDHSIGMMRTQILGEVARLGIADQLASGPRTAEQLAAVLEVDADALHRLCRAAGQFRILDLDAEGRFSLTPLGRTLRSDATVSMRPWCTYFASRSNSEAWTDLGETVRTGRNAFHRVHGSSVWDWFDAHPDEGRMFASSMRRMTELDAPAVAAGYPFPATGTVCDVAGGVGTLLSHVLERHRGLRGVLVEAPLVLKEAEDLLEARALRDRVELVEGNIFERVEASADVYLMKDILHDWDDTACRQILSTVRAAMPQGSTLVLVESVQERNKVDQFASVVDVHMMTVCEEGRQRSVEELQALLAGVGLTPGPVVVTAGLSRLVTGIS